LEEARNEKILVAIDGSEGALKAVDYVGRQFAGTADMQITLFNVSPGVPPELWDDGHILSEEENADRRRYLISGSTIRDLSFNPFSSLPSRRLQKRDRTKQIETKSASETVKNTPECILAEAKTGGY